MIVVRDSRIGVSCLLWPGGRLRREFGSSEFKMRWLSLSFLFWCPLQNSGFHEIMIYCWKKKTYFLRKFGLIFSLKVRHKIIWHEKIILNWQKIFNTRMKLFIHVFSFLNFWYLYNFLEVLWETIQSIPQMELCVLSVISTLLVGIVKRVFFRQSKLCNFSSICNILLNSRLSDCLGHDTKLINVVLSHVIPDEKFITNLTGFFRKGWQIKCSNFVL